MRKKSFAAALLAIAAIATTASAGIEVLGIEVLQGSEFHVVHVYTAGAPDGSMAEVYMNDGVQEHYLNEGPIDPATGMAMVTIPPLPVGTHLTVKIVDRTGIVLADYIDGLIIE